MKIKFTAVAMGMVLVSAPLAAQITPRGDGASRTGTTARERVEAAAEILGGVRTDGGVYDSRTRDTRSSRVPPGHLPPRGMCRVWIDGVPPGQQPPVTDCATAERNRVANSRVIYGDRETFRGRAKGKFKTKNRDSASQRQCTIWDGVVVDGRVVNVCRDGTVRDDRRSRQTGRVIDRSDDRWDDDDDSDSDSDEKGKWKQKGKSRG